MTSDCATLKHVQHRILGLYTTFVFLVSRLIRGLFDDVSFKVIYTQMPNVDKVLQLCLDIYLVRESREFTLEEDLYAKLLFCTDRRKL